MASEPCLCGSPTCRSCFPSQRTRKLAEALSSEEYAEKGSGYCPVCGSWEISGRAIDIDGPYAEQDMHCGMCEASWRDVYQLLKYDNLDVPY